MTDSDSQTPPLPERSDVRLPGPSYAGASIHMSWPFGRTKITSMKVIRLTFPKDHGLLTDNNTDWTTPGSRFSKPEWTFGKKSFPVSYQKKQSITVEVAFEVNPPTADATDADVTGTAAFGSLVFTATNQSFKGGVVTISASATEPLPDQVNIFTGDIAWSVNTAKDGPFPAGSSWGHTIYTTYDIPYCSTSRDNEVTEKRLSFLCNLCKGQSNGHDSVKSIHDLTGRYVPQAPTPGKHWTIADGTPGQCIDLVFFYQLATEMLGLRAGQVVRIFPTLGKSFRESSSFADQPETRTISTSLPAHVRTGHSTLQAEEELRFIDKHGDTNGFEACYKFTHPDSSGTTVTRYYGGGARVYDKVDDVMKDVCDRTVWVYLAHTIPDEDWQHCKSPGPYPAEQW